MKVGCVAIGVTRSAISKDTVCCCVVLPSIAPVKARSSVSACAVRAVAPRMMALARERAMRRMMWLFVEGLVAG